MTKRTVAIVGTPDMTEATQRLLKELDIVLEIYEAAIPANPAAPTNAKLENDAVRILRRYFKAIADAFPYGALDELYTRMVVTEADPEAFTESANQAGAMLAIRIPEDVAGRIALPGGEDRRDLHITLFYFGDDADLTEQQHTDIIGVAAGAIRGTKKLNIRLKGTGTFPNEEHPYYAVVKSPALLEMRAKIAAAYDAAGIEYSKEHEYHPHVTLRYLGDQPTPDTDIDEAFLATAVTAYFAGARSDIITREADPEAFLEVGPTDADMDQLLNGVLNMFETQLTADMTAHHVNAYLVGSAQMMSWGKTKDRGLPILYEGPPIQQAIDYSQLHCAQLVTRMNQTTKKQLKTVIANGIKNKRGIPGLTTDIKQAMGWMGRNQPSAIKGLTQQARARMIARTETCDALEQAFVDRAKAMDVTGKEWVVTEPCPICSANGAAGVIPIDSAFPSGHLRPPAHPNCRCALAPVMLDELNNPLQVGATKKQAPAGTKKAKPKAKAPAKAKTKAPAPAPAPKGAVGPDGTVADFTPENGGHLFHGSDSAGWTKFQGDVVYLTDDWAEAVGYSRGAALNGTGAGKPNTMIVKAPKGRMFNADNMVAKGIADDLDDPVADAIAYARRKEYDYLTYYHPSNVYTDREQRVIVALKPSNLKITRRWETSTDWWLTPPDVVREFERAFADEFVGSKVEHARVMMPNGNVGYKKGTRTKVAFDTTEQRKMYGAKSFIHNHPNGAPLSYQDIAFMEDIHCGRMVAATKDYYYILEPAETWSEARPYAMSTRYKMLRAKHVKDAQLKYSAEQSVVEGQIHRYTRPGDPGYKPWDDYVDEYWAAMEADLAELAPKYGLKFTKEAQ